MAKDTAFATIAPPDFPLTGLPLGYAAPQEREAMGFGRQSEVADASEQLLSDQGEGHLMTFAPTGAGKGVSYAIPALLAYPGSAVVIDIKGELAEVTARARREMGQRVIVLDPFNVTRHEGAALNPLDLIVSGSEEAIDDCTGLACAVATDVGLKDPFWEERAKHLIAQTLLYITSDAQPEARTLRELWRVLNLTQREFDATTKAMLASRNEQVRAGAGMITTADSRVLASIFTCAQRFVEPFRSDAAARAMARTSFKFDAFLRGDPITIYLVLPPERLTSHAALLRIWLSTFFILALRRKQLPLHPTLFLIDEAAQLGRLDHLVSAMTLLRGYGVKTWTFWQDTQQLETAYASEWRSLFNNAATHIAFGRMTPMAAKGIADLLDTPRSRIYDLKDQEALLLEQGSSVRTIRRLDYRRDAALSARADDNRRHLSTQIYPRRPAGKPHVTLVAAKLRARAETEAARDEDPHLVPFKDVMRELALSGRLGW